MASLLIEYLCANLRVLNDKCSYYSGLQVVMAASRKFYLAR